MPRRALAAGVAWSVPILTLASQSPAFAASAAPACPTCLAASAGGLFTAQAVTVGGLSDVTGTAVMNIDSTSCPLNLFQPAFAVVGLSGTLTWSTGVTSPTTVSVSAGAGTLGQISAITTTFTDLGESIPNGSGLLGLYGSGQKHPTNICFTFNAIFVAIIPLGLQVTCRYRMCYPINNVLPTGTVLGGAGTVNWTGVLGAGTLTPA